MAASKFLIKQETSLTNCANNEKEHTKGTVLLVCFLCDDIGVCIETCRRHVPTLRCDLRASLIVAGMNHRKLLRLTRIQREDYLWKFVLICG